MDWYSKVYWRIVEAMRGTGLFSSATALLGKVKNSSAEAWCRMDTQGRGEVRSHLVVLC